MNYKFKKYNISSSDTPMKDRVFDLGVDYDSLNVEEKALSSINSHLWTPIMIQKLIDECHMLTDEEELEFKGEGSNLFMIIDRQEVYFYNSLESKEEEDFIWTFNKFIQFLEDFKVFVEENR